MDTKPQHRKKAAPVICAAVIIGILIIYLAFVLFLMISAAHGGLTAVLFLAIYAVAIAAVTIGILLALRQRLKEIEGGEEDVAAQY